MRIFGLGTGIRAKFGVIMASILLASTVASSLVLSRRQSQNLQGALLAKGRSLGTVVAKLSWEPLLTGEVNQLDGIVGDVTRVEADVVWALVTDAGGSALTSPAVSVNRKVPGAEAALEGAKDLGALEAVAALRARLPVAELDLPIVLGERTIGHLSLGMSEEAIRAEGRRTVAFVALVNVAMALGLGFLLLLALQRIVIRPLGGEPAYAVEVARRVADGELDFVIQTRAGDERSAMAALRKMVARLREVASQVQTTSSAVASAAGQVASSGGQEYAPGVVALAAVRKVADMVAADPTGIGGLGRGFTDSRTRVVRTRVVERPLGFLTIGPPKPAVKSVIDAFKAEAARR